MEPKRRVVIESPYAGNTDALTERNIRYVRACLRDSLLRGEAPFASHALYTLPGVLDDRVAEERELGIAAGFEWRQGAHTAFYLDLGWSPGMLRGKKVCLLHGHSYDERYLGDRWQA